MTTDRDMNTGSIGERVDTLEHAVGALMTLPVQVAVLRSEFHGFRVESRAFHDEMRLFQEVVATNFTRLENALRGGDEETRRTLREEMRQGDEETRGLMLVLHDKVMLTLAEVLTRLDALERD
jgi:hypothetical protein